MIIIYDLVVNRFLFNQRYFNTIIISESVISQIEKKIRRVCAVDKMERVQFNCCINPQLTNCGLDFPTQYNSRLFQYHKFAILEFYEHAYTVMQGHQ